MQYQNITPEEMKHPCSLLNPAEIIDGWGIEEDPMYVDTDYALVKVVELARSMGWVMVSPAFPKLTEAKEWAKENGYANEFGNIHKGYKIQRTAKEHE